MLYMLINVVRKFRPYLDHKSQEDWIIKYYHRLLKSRFLSSMVFPGRIENITGTEMNQRSWFMQKEQWHR
jgi:hypothetical protein